MKEKQTPQLENKHARIIPYTQIVGASNRYWKLLGHLIDRSGFLFV